MRNKKGRVIWITGLSGAGKTTLAETLLPHLPDATLWYDGHHITQMLPQQRSGLYDRQSRLSDARRSGPLYKHAADQGLTVVCSTIAMFHEIQDWNRQNLPGYFEVYLDIPMEILIKRDYKGVYNSRTPVYGREIPLEAPRCPEIHIQDPDLTPEEAAKMVIEKLNEESL